MKIVKQTNPVPFQKIKAWNFIGEKKKEVLFIIRDDTQEFPLFCIEDMTKREIINSRKCPIKKYKHWEPTGDTVAGIPIKKVQAWRQSAS